MVITKLKENNGVILSKYIVCTGRATITDTDESGHVSPYKGSSAQQQKRKIRF